MTSSLHSPGLQSELVLFAQANSAAIAALLRRSQDWLSASDILTRLNWIDSESNRRLVRKCAEELGSELISGQSGYKHIENATADEVRHFANWMKSQGGKMVSRAQAALARKGL
jgi:hypothetical protein